VHPRERGFPDPLTRHSSRLHRDSCAPSPTCRGRGKPTGALTTMARALLPSPLRGRGPSEPSRCPGGRDRGEGAALAWMHAGRSAGANLSARQRVAALHCLVLLGEAMPVEESGMTSSQQARDAPRRPVCPERPLFYTSAWGAKSPRFIRTNKSVPPAKGYAPIPSLAKTSTASDTVPASKYRNGLIRLISYPL